MNKPLINILIRVHRRQELLARLVKSIKSQTYTNYRVIVSCEDDADAYMAWTMGLQDFIEVKKESEKCFYNLYCNHLKSKVEDGWFIFVDSDDMLNGPSALEGLAKHLDSEDEMVICQFMRGSRLKPSNEMIKSGAIEHSKIGMPCIVLHAKNKEAAMIGDSTDSDYWYALELRSKLKTKFIQHAVVKCDRRSYGK